MHELHARAQGEKLRTQNLDTFFYLMNLEDDLLESEEKPLQPDPGQE